MEFFKNNKQIKYYIILLGVFLSINSPKSLASENKLYFGENNKYFDFEQVYFQNSIPYSEYDSLEGQIKSFFGLRSELSKTNYYPNYYPDLIIISDSDSIREIYRSKLNDMIEFESIYKLKK